MDDRRACSPRAERPALGPSQAKAGYVMDIYDGADWTEMDIEDLKAAIEHGDSIEHAAEFLRRSVSVDEVASKGERTRLAAKETKIVVEVTMIKPGIDADRIAETEADHFMKCPACDQWFDMRDLGQVLEQCARLVSLNAVHTMCTHGPRCE
jgi:hypothetical protein